MVAPLITAATTAVGGSSGSGGGISQYTEIAGGILNGLFDMIITAVPTKYDKARKKRIGELTDRKESGDLGMTESQLQEIQTLAQAGIQSAQKEFFNRQSDVLRTAEPQSATALAIQQQAAREALRTQQSELNKEILQTERKTEADQLNELNALNAEQRARNEQIKKSVGSFLSLGLAGGAKAVDTRDATKTITGDTNVSGSPVAASTPSTLEEWRARYPELQHIMTDEQIQAILDSNTGAN